METRYKEAAQHLERAMVMGRADGSVGPSTIWAFKLAIQLLLVAEQNKTISKRSNEDADYSLFRNAG